MLVSYFGGKGNMINDLLPYLENAPTHYAYYVPYGGSFQSIYHKNPVRIEVYNDTDKRMVNFMTVVRDLKDELIKKLSLTPYAREEFYKCMPVSPDPVEDARRVFVLLNQGRNGRLSDPCWHMPKYANPAQGNRPTYFKNKINEIEEAARRLTNVHIENTTATKILKNAFHEGALIYLDPPYLPETRTAAKYTNDMTREDHTELLEMITGDTEGASIAISGYDNDLYNNYLQGWNKALFKVGTRGSKGGDSTKKIECLWFNYELKKIDYIQGGLL